MPESENESKERKEMQRSPNGDDGAFGVEMLAAASEDVGVILGLDGGTTSTVCVCIPAMASIPFVGSTDDEYLPVLSRAKAGCSNYNSVGEAAAKETVQKVISEALSMARSKHSVVRAICLAMSGVNHPSDQQKIMAWVRDLFPCHVKIFIENDAVAAMASGTMGKLHGCVLIAGTGCIAYGFSEGGRQARALGAGPILGDWGSGYGIAALALTAVVRAHDGRGPQTLLTQNILKVLGLSSPDELIGWTYADPSWARIAALVPVVVASAEDGDEVADKILHYSVGELADGVKAVIQRLKLCGEDGKSPFPLVMVGGVLEANDKKWNIGKELMKYISNDYPGVQPIQPKVEPAMGAALVAWSRHTS